MKRIYISSLAGLPPFQKSCVKGASTAKYRDWERGAFPRACTCFLRPSGSFKSLTAAVMFAAVLLTGALDARAAAPKNPFWRGMNEAALTKMVGTDKFAYIDRAGGERAVVGMIVDAAPDKVWAVLTDFENYTKYIRECTGVKVKNKTDKGATVSFKMSLLKAGPVNLTSDYTLAYTMDAGKRMEFETTGDKGKGLNGAWELVPAKGGKRTILFYDAYSDFKTAGALAKHMVERSPSLQIAVSLANAMIYVEQIKRASEKKAR
jgi:ribosome-associated toxin RatA of RatAB toxin-antitoxin module